jgi:hypothetical protein
MDRASTIDDSRELKSIFLCTHSYLELFLSVL